MLAWRNAFFVPVLFSLAVTGQPSLAGDYRGAVEKEGRRGGIFAGATLRLALNGGQSAKPIARLKLSPTSSASTNSGAITPPAGSGIEFGVSRAGKPDLFFAGQSIANLKRQLNVRGDATPLVIGGIALAALAVFLITAEDDDDTEKPGFVCPPDPPELCLK